MKDGGQSAVSIPTSKQAACCEGGKHCDAEAIADPQDRDFRMDALRGLALWWIFLDHVPETYLNHVTPKNFGFSDAAEILVFLSGLASGSVYGRLARHSGLMAALKRVLRRAFEIYIAQIVTVIFLLAEITLLAVHQPSLMDHANLAVFAASPAQTMFQAIILRYSPVNLDPLLLMVILHFGLIIVLPAMTRWPSQVLIASAALYVASHWFDWSIPAYPRGVIYFNPLDWQLLYVMGIWWGIKQDGKPLELLKAPLLALLAAIYVLFSLFITLGWHFHALEAYVPTLIVRAIYPIDKGDLDILRLLHFLALALLCWRLLPCDLPILRTRLSRPLVQCGRYSLAIYCASVLLSFGAHALLSAGWNNVVSQTLVSAAGILIMILIAALLARIDLVDNGQPRSL